MSMLNLETVERSSIFTRLDFRTKLLMMLVIMILSVLWMSPVVNFAMAMVIIGACFVAGIKPGYIWGIVRTLLVFWIIIVLIQGFLGEALASRLSGHAVLTPIFTFPQQWPLVGGGTLTVEGTLFGLNVVFKSLAMVLSVYLAILTTDLDNIVVSMVRSRSRTRWRLCSRARALFPDAVRADPDDHRGAAPAWPGSGENEHHPARACIRGSGYRSSSMPWPNRSSSTSSCSPRGSAGARSALTATRRT